MRGLRELWNNRPVPTPDNSGNHGGVRGGCTVGEKETSDLLGAKVTTVLLPGGAAEGDKVGDISGVTTPAGNKGI